MSRFLPLFACALLVGCSPPRTQAPATDPSPVSPVSSHSPDSLRIAYVGNMGVLLECGDRTVLIDGLHEPYRPAYLPPADSVVAQLIAGTYPGFTAVELVLHTHRHRDHFSDRLAARFLAANPAARVLGAGQITAAIGRESADSALISRAVTLPYGRAATTWEQAGITVRSVRCDHANPERHGSTQNLAFLVEIGGFRVLHVGDTDWPHVGEPFAALGLGNLEPDVAILPFWMLSQAGAPEQVRLALAARRLVATHVDPAAAARTRHRVHANFPAARVLASPGAGIGLGH